MNQEGLEVSRVTKQREKRKKKLTWHETHMDIARVVARRSHCCWLAIGAVLANMESRHEKIIATGYNGPPRTIPNCDEVGCTKYDKSGIAIPNGRCRGAHAEMNAFLNAANAGISTNGATLYCTLSPCLECAKHIINSGIKEVIWLELYSEHFPDKKKEAEQAIDLIRKSDVGIHIRSYAEAIGKDLAE